MIDLGSQVDSKHLRANSSSVVEGTVKPRPGLESVPISSKLVATVKPECRVTPSMFWKAL